MSLSPGDQAIVPARWSMRLPPGLYLCQEVDETELEVIPGIVDESPGTMLCVANSSKQDLPLDDGAVLAQLSIAQDFQWTRNGLHPTTGAMPDMLEASDGILAFTEYEDRNMESVKSLAPTSKKVRWEDRSRSPEPGRS